MSTLTVETFTARIAEGCPSCGGKKLLIRSYVEGRFPLLEGESDGTVAWAYKGETFVDGVFDVRCAGCKAALFTDTRCPRCHAADGLARALETTNARVVPTACPRCEDDSIVYGAFVPADVVYQGKRADKARTSYGLEDAGFHGVRVDCTACGVLEASPEGCPLCGEPGPIRPQPT